MVKADLRFRQSRLMLEISGAGPVQFAEVNGRRIEPDSNGAIRLPPDFAGGTALIRTAEPK